MVGAFIAADCHCAADLPFQPQNNLDGFIQRQIAIDTTRKSASIRKILLFTMCRRKKLHAIMKEIEGRVFRYLPQCRRGILESTNHRSPLPRFNVETLRCRQGLRLLWCDLRNLHGWHRCRKQRCAQAEEDGRHCSQYLASPRITISCWMGFHISSIVLFENHWFHPWAPPCSCMITFEIHRKTQ